jgi:galactonate dehydratase
MKIEGITTYACNSPVTDWVYVKVSTGEPGLYGWGECSLPGKPHGVQGAVEDLVKLVAGADPRDTEWCWQRMYRHGYWRGGPIQTAAMSGIDMALWDIRGKAVQQPIYRLLGGAVRSRIPLYANLGLSTSPDEFRVRTRHALALGYKTVKIYPLPTVGAIAGLQVIRQVVACCEAVREELGTHADFALDFHGRPGAGLAVQLEAAVRHTHPLWIEEPVLPETENGLKRCAEKFQTPIAAGERLFTRWDFRTLLEQELVSVIQPDVANAGGITEMVKLAALAELYGVAFNPHNPNGPLQSTASLHLAAHAQAFTMLEHRHEHHDFMAEICTTFPKVAADGCCALPDGVGLGATMHEEALLAHPVQDWIPESFRDDGAIADW